MVSVVATDLRPARRGEIPLGMRMKSLKKTNIKVGLQADIQF
jgi:hypothetical protein